MTATINELKEQYDLLIKYIDEDKQFGYFQFMNNYDQQIYKISSNVQSVIIIDTSTGYFNATKLFITCSITDLSLTNYMKSKTFQLLVDELKKSVLNEQHAYYQITRNNQNELYYGLYFHPYLLANLIMTINPLISFKFSEFMKDFFIYQATNKSMTTDTLISNNRYNAVNDINEYIDISNIVLDYECDNIEGILKRCNSRTKELLTENTKFDLAQFNKTKNWKQDYITHLIPTSCSSLSLTSYKSETNLSKNKSKSKSKNKNNETINEQFTQRFKILDSRFQAIIAIAHYDKKGMYAYGSKSYKLTLDLINKDDLNQYMELFQKPLATIGGNYKLSEAEYEELIFNDKLKVKTDIVAKFVNLHDVPCDFMYKFIESYDQYFEVEIKVIDRVEYLTINNLDKFKFYFSDFLLPYMDY